MQVDYIALSVPVFFLLIALELGYSAYKGLRLYTLSDAITNISCGIGQQLSGIFFKTFLFAGYYWIYEHLRFATIPQSGIWWVVLFIGVDFCYYWFHRFSHELNAIWATHIVHHQSEEYNLTVALRQSWFQSFFSNLFYLPLAFIGFDPLTTLSVIAFNTLYQFWIHTELIGRMGPFEWVFNTPSHHRVHHGSNPEYIDRNHGGTLIIWDRLFGTFEPERAPVVYGITTPLNSWNPVWANLHYWAELFQLARQSRRFTDKLNVFFAPPGWKPAEAGGRQYPQPVSRSQFHKFHIRIPKQRSTYVLVQFAVLLGASSFLLFQAAKFPLIKLLFPAGVVLLSLVSLGQMLEKRPTAPWLETLRLLLLPLGVYVLGMPAAVWLGTMVYAVLSLLALMLIRKS